MVAFDCSNPHPPPPSTDAAVRAARALLDRGGAARGVDGGGEGTSNTDWLILRPSSPPFPSAPVYEACARNTGKEKDSDGPS